MTGTTWQMKYIKITSHFITLISLPPSYFPITHLFMQSISLFISSHPCFHHPSLSPNALFSVCLSFSIFSVPLLPVLGAVPQQWGGEGEREREREKCGWRRKKGSDERRGLCLLSSVLCKSIRPFACPFTLSTTSLSPSISPLIQRLGSKQEEIHKTRGGGWERDTEEEQVIEISSNIYNAYTYWVYLDMMSFLNDVSVAVIHRVSCHFMYWFKQDQDLCSFYQGLFWMWLLLKVMRSGYVHHSIYWNTQDYNR